MWLLSVLVVVEVTPVVGRTTVSMHSAQAESVQLVAPSPSGGVAPEGHFLVSWRVNQSVNADDPLSFEVQFGSDPTFAQHETRAAGHDLATFLSGLPQGTTFVRVRPMTSGSATSPDWSETRSIVVSYPSMGLVGVLATLGVLTFVVLVVIIWRGHLRRTVVMVSVAAIS